MSSLHLTVGRRPAEAPEFLISEARHSSARATNSIMAATD
jgi:hypothetical protein